MIEAAPCPGNRHFAGNAMAAAPFIAVFAGWRAPSGACYGSIRSQRRKRKIVRPPRRIPGETTSWQHGNR